MPENSSKKLPETGTYYTTEEVNGQLRSLMVTKFSAAVGSGNLTIEKFAGNIEDLSKEIQVRLNQDFADYGLEITKFLVENISMPDKIKEEIFEYSRLNKIDMSKLTQFKAAQSIETAAANQGIGGMGVGMGVGMGMGNMVSNAMANATQANQNAGTPPPIPGAVSYFVAVNGQQSGPFDMNGLKTLVSSSQLSRETLVWTNSMAGWAAAGSVVELAGLFTNTPPPLPGQ